MAAKADRIDPRGTVRTVAIDRDIAGIACAGAGSHGSVGVAAWKLDGSGPLVLYNADENFPMASTFKVAVAGVDAAVTKQAIGTPALC